MDYAKTFSEPLVAVWTRIAEFVPYIIVAFLVLILGLLLIPLIGSIIHKSLRFMKIDELAENSGVSSALAGIGMDFSFAKAVTDIIKFVLYVFLFSVLMEILNLTQITGLINDLLRYIPQVIVAVVLFGAGLTFGEFFKKITMKMAEATSMASKDGALLGMVGKYAIVIFAGMAALVQLGIAQELVQILFAGIIAGCALAFGLGSKGRVERFWSDMSEKHDK